MRNVTIWRDPSEESVDLYPGLVVWDDRAGDSIIAGRSRLPLWAFIHTVVRAGFDAAEDGWSPSTYLEDDDLGLFLVNLLEARGEFGRLLLVLADAERAARDRGSFCFWWEEPDLSRRVVEQLERCLRSLEPDSPNLRERLIATPILRAMWWFLDEGQVKPEWMLRVEAFLWQLTGQHEIAEVIREQIG